MDNPQTLATLEKMIREYLNQSPGELVTRDIKVTCLSQACVDMFEKALKERAQLELKRIMEKPMSERPLDKRKYPLTPNEATNETEETKTTE